jgi:hypothetical protein
MTKAHLILLFKFYNLEDEIGKTSTVPQMRAFFGKFLDIQKYPIEGRNYNNLMRPETKSYVVRGLLPEEMKQRAKKVE